ncbi:immunoglobulin superfamily member 6 [Brienomyrus brachyistius]|uniref:immunoglobulin superfamily member 6 n=1 Tax=Brienomyrus brachyistius TaxID=42636 RepID=UPI0020B185E1|nr:immunoglobulin superfamily member 6 [Brienomyrus brachyistius]
MTLETSLISLFAFMLTCTVHACQINIQQQDLVSKWRGSAETTLHCEVNGTSDCVADRTWTFVWFKFEANSSRSLWSKGNARELLIRNVTVNDSGVYYCGVIVNDFTQSGGRYIGRGTLLVVREYSHVKHALVWTLFGLLALYSLALLVLLILKKMQRKTATFAGREHGNGGKGEPKRSAQFRSVVRELYSRRNLQKHMKKHCVTPAQPKDELTCSDAVDETVYQNM